MKTSFQLKALAVAVVALAGSQAAQAITPWQANDANASNYGTPDFVIYTSGGAAQDLAYGQVVLDVLSQPGTVDIFEDEVSPTNTSKGSRFTAYYFIGSQNLTDVALRGKKILLEKRSLGAAGYGVVPLVGNIPLDHLDIFKTTAANWTPLPTDATVHYADISAANASTYLSQHTSQGGFTGVDGAALLAAGTANYPAAVTELTTNAPTAGWVTNYQPSDLAAANITRIPAGGFVYGVGVTLDLYKVLQAAQVKTGKLPSTTVIGAYDEASLPSLNRNFVASLLAGKIKQWSDVKINDGGIVKSLNDPSILAAANVTAPTAPKVAVGLRNSGAAIGAVAYAKFLNYPYVESSFGLPPATGNTAASENLAKPLVKLPGGASATGNLLADWQAGTNISLLNNVAGARYWGIAINSADRNTNVSAAGISQPAVGDLPKGQDWRYVKIDGYAPTIENVAAGAYPDWAEGEVLIRPDATAEETSLLTDFANGLGSLAVAAKVDTALIQPWGQTGIFATTVTDPGAVSIPFDPLHPIVDLTHNNSNGYTHLGIVPTAHANTNAATIELK